MARTKLAKNLTPAEAKEAKKGLKEALKNADANLSPFKVAAKAAEKDLTLAKKTADKTVAGATKAYEAAKGKLAKAEAAHQKGVEKINARLAELQPDAA